MSGSEAGDSVTALEYIESQEELERNAREMMPYNFDTCTYFLGQLRQPIYACRTCSPDVGFERGGVCYSCSISCHGEHELTELFTKQNFTCDCGTQRLGCACKLRSDIYPTAPALNRYNHNFEGRFCDCDYVYDAEKEDGTMVQCLVGTACGEDWFHDRCIGKIPEGLIGDDGYFVCWKCVATLPWMRRYISREGFVGVAHEDSKKRKVDLDATETPSKRARLNDEHAVKADPSVEKDREETKATLQQPEACLLDVLPLDRGDDVSIFLIEAFRDRLCKCSRCISMYPPILLEDIPIYEAPLDEDDLSSIHDAAASALNSLPRERAIDGIMAYQRMKDRLTAFLRPYAEDGKVVSEEDVKKYFEQAREEDKAAKA